MSSMTPKALTSGAKSFAESEFGKWFIEEVERREQNYLTLAEQSDAHNVTVNSVMRAAGLREALNIVKDNAGIAEAGYLK